MRLLTVFLTIQLLLSCHSAPGPRTVSLQATDVVSSVTVVGRVESRRQVVHTASYEGQIKQLLVKTGQSVKKGDPLLVLDPKSLNEKIRDAQSRWAQVNGKKASLSAQIVSKQRELSRSRALLKSRSIAQAEVEKAENDLRGSEIELTSTLEELKLSAESLRVLRSEQADSTLRASIGGVVTSTWVNREQFVPNSVVKLGDQLVTISESGDLVLRAQIRETDVLKLDVNQEVTVNLPAAQGDLSWVGRVAEVDNAATIDKNTGVATFKVAIHFRADGQKIKSGMEGRATALIAKKENISALPRAALGIQSGKYFVLLKTDQGFVQKEVSIGLLGDTNVEITKGLAVGELVAAIYDQANY